MSKLIYRFNNQRTQSSFNSKIILGGKGANLAQMAKLGLPVPPGFTISTKVCEDFYKNNKKIPKKLIQQVKKEIKIIEKISKKKFGNLLNHPNHLLRVQYLVLHLWLTYNCQLPLQKNEALFHEQHCRTFE